VSRRKSRRSTHHNAMLLQVAATMAHLGGWVVDLQRNRIELSDEASAIHGLPAGTTLAVDESFQFYAPQWRGRIRDLFEACARMGIPYDEEMEFVTATGRCIWVRTMGRPVRDDKGVIRRLEGVLQDIQANKKSEEEVRRLANRLTNTLESITDAFYTLNKQWRFTYVNRAAEQLLRYKRSELLGRNVWELFPAAIGTNVEQEYHLAMKEFRSRHFETYYPPYAKWVEVHVYPSEEGLAVHNRDITDRKQAEADTRFLAMFDPLTRLPNRRLLLDRLHQSMATCARCGEHGAILFLDLDNFKVLNDTRGHAVGDRLLQQVATRLGTSVREGDTVGRFGGDEFVIILERLSGDYDTAVLQADAVGEKLLESFHQPFQLDEHSHHTSASVGITLFAGDQSPRAVDNVMKRADLAMYQAKAQGGNAVRLFDPAMQEKINTRTAMEKQMREGLERGEFFPLYQPQVDARGRLIGAEALVRWQHPQRGLVAPDDFIALAENTRLIIPLGKVILEHVCRQLACWSREPATASLRLAVNVSAKQFHHPDFAAQVLEVVHGTGANPEQLTLEITESLLLRDLEDITEKMTSLKAHGIRFSLDDFGTGYSSLYYLKHLPLSELKIDQHFIRGLFTGHNDAAIVRTIIALANNLELTVIAEGVETREVWEYLQRHGCSTFQGYYFSPPIPISELNAFRERGDS